MKRWVDYSFTIVLLFCLTFSTLVMADTVHVPFTIKNFMAVEHSQVYVQGGIPLPQGKVQADMRLHIMKQDAPIPGEVKITGYWPDGSVKWVLVRMQSDFGVNEIQSYTLVCDSINSSVSLPAIAQEDDSRIYVDTGVLRFQIHKTTANVFEQLSIQNDEEWESIVSDPSQVGLFFEISDSAQKVKQPRHFESNSDTKHFKAVLEEATPLVSIIRLEGIHTSKSGKIFAPYTMRIYAYKNSHLIRLVHTFIYDGDARKDFVQAIGLELTFPAEDIKGYTFGTDRGYGAHTVYTQDPSLPAWRRGVLSQESAHHYRITKVINPETNSTLDVHEGNRSQGWGQMHSAKNRISVGMKNFWQEYPKAIEIDAEERSIKTYFYSPYSDPLDLRRYSDLGYHALYEAGAGPAGTQASPFNHEKYNASYISKSTELFLDITSSAAQVPPMAVTALLFQRPPILSASPEWVAETKVLGSVTPLTKLPHPKAQEYYTTCMNLLIDEQERNSWYSFIDYGDAMHSFHPAKDIWRYDEGGYAWLNNEGQITGAYWLAYLTTGDERAYRFAEAMTKHVQDVDMFQAGPMAGRGMRHNVNHWGCVDRERRMTIPFNKRLYYFLSGDEHTRDRIHFIYDQLNTGPGHYAAMDYAVGATALLFLWETTGETKYGQALQQAAETFCSKPVGGFGYPASLSLDISTGKGSVKDGIGMLPDYFLMFFGPIRILMETEALTQSEIVKASILNWATLLLKPEEEAKKHQLNFSVGSGGANSHMQVAAYAYTHTGDERYLKIIRSAYDKPTLQFDKVGGSGPLDTAPHTKITSPNSFQSNSIAVTLFNYPYGAAVLTNPPTAKP